MSSLCRSWIQENN